MSDPIWWTDFKKSFNFYETRYLGVSKVANYETEFRFLEFKNYVGFYCAEY